MKRSPGAAAGHHLQWHAALYLGALLLASSAYADDARYFPVGSHDQDANTDAFVEAWYSTQLRALKEQPLCCGAVSPGFTLRFTWLRTFDHPVVLRLDNASGNTWMLTTKIASGMGAYKPGRLSINTTYSVSADEAMRIAAAIRSRDTFWKMPTAAGLAVAPGELPREMGADGSQWIVEVLDGSRYHYTDEWSPESGLVRDIGMQLIKLSHREFSKIY